MKITALQVRCVHVPMPQSHRTASGTVSLSPLALLTLATDEGIEGHSMVFSYSPAALKPLGELMKNMEPLVAGQALAPAALSDQLHARFRLLGTHGLVGMALAGIDMAMWDAHARWLGQPLLAVLGAAPRPVPAYGGIGYDGASDCARAAEDWAREGFKAVKAKIGYPTLAEDLAVVRAMRSAVGSEVAIMVDYNQSLQPAEALARLRALDDEGLAWIEEPVLANDFQGLAALARQVRTPLQAGENWWGPLDFAQALNAGCGPLAMPDMMKCGGVTGWQRIAALGHAQGLSLSNHLWPEISTQLLCATPTAHWLECVDWWNPVLEQPLELREGLAYPSTRPGSGVEFDDEAVQRYAV
jgi:mandelate racemase